MSAITMFINTTIDDFVYWVDHHTSHSYEHPQTHRHGALKFQLASVLERNRKLFKYGREGIAKNLETGHFLIRVLAYHVTREGARIAGDIEFDMISLSPSRIEVRVESLGFPDLYPFTQLLRDIAERYPETEKTVREYVKKKPCAPLPEPTPPQGAGGGAGGKERSSELELISLRRQLDAGQENLLLIQERLSEYVLETDRPLDLVKQERQKKERIEELERRIAERAGK